MKFNKLIIALCSVAAVTAVVSCGSGSSSNPNPQPTVSPLSLPTGFDLAPGGSTSGIGYNAESMQIAIPGQGKYNILQLSESQADLIESAIANGNNFVQSGGGLVAILPNTSSSLQSSHNRSDVQLQAVNQDSLILGFPSGTSTGSQAFMASFTTINYPGIPIQVTTTVVGDSAVVTTAGPTGPTSGALGTTLLLPAQTTSGALNNISITMKDTVNTPCPGEPRSITSGTNNNTLYTSWGTSDGKICVFKNTDGIESATNLAAEAPTTGLNKYTPGNVNYLGFTNNQGNNYVGYWYVGNQIYKVFGKYSNNSPVGSGFLNITSESANQSSGGSQAQTVTFTNAPSADNINSTYVDQFNNVFVGTKNGLVYSLANGQTSWLVTHPFVITGGTQQYFTGNVTLSPVSYGFALNNEVFPGATATASQGTSSIGTNLY